jgi:hypothetical protein
MHPTKQTHEMELSLYYSRVEPHMGHLQLRTKAPAAPDHLKWHSTRCQYSFSSISMPLSERCSRDQKVQGVHRVHIEVPPHNEWPGQAHHGDLLVAQPRNRKDKGAEQPIDWYAGHQLHRSEHPIEMVTALTHWKLRHHSQSAALMHTMAIWNYKFLVNYYLHILWSVALA